jgi:hypothetical protein
MPFCRPGTLFEHYGCGGDETPLPGSTSLVQPRELRTESIATHESRQAGRQAGRPGKGRNTPCFNLFWICLLLLSLVDSC